MDQMYYLHLVDFYGKNVGKKNMWIFMVNFAVKGEHVTVLGDGAIEEWMYDVMFRDGEKSENGEDLV